MDDTDGGSHGLLSTDPQVNPDFHQWNMVKVQYCDGGFFAGDRVDPIPHNGVPLYFRGRYIVEELFSTLMNQFNMSNADQIIITGCSAGGMAVYLHLDWIRDRIPRHIRVVGAPDSGFFMDIPNYRGDYLLTPVYQATYALHNATFVDEDCLETVDPTLYYQCAGAYYGSQYVDTPLFVMNSLSDTYQLQNLLMLNCFQDGELKNCSRDELDAIADFRKTMIKQLRQKVLKKRANGAYLPSCLTHCGACTDPFWSQTTVGGEHLRDAFATWFFKRTQTRSIDIDGPWPSDSCKLI
jgi:hypothetical protein